MGVDWSLAGKNQYDYLDSLQQLGNVQAQKFNLQRGQYDFGRQQQQDQSRPALFAQAQGGDFKGAQAGALAGNDLDAYKVIAGLNEQQRNQVKLHSQLIGGFAASLSQLPQGEARVAAFRAAAPQLKAQGFTDEEINSADLSDNGLRGYIAAAGATDNALEAYYKSQQPLTVADGTQVYGATPMGGGARPLLAENAKDPPPPDYQFDSVSGQWLLKPGTGGSANGGLPTGQPGGGGQPVGGGGSTAVPDLVSNIKRVEGTGRNPKSSASGQGQMINSTFVSTFRKTFPDQAGLSNSQILAKRGTGVEDAMLATLTQDNIKALTDVGIPVTPGNAYIAHFLGAGGALSALRSPPNTPLSYVMPPEVMKANPFLAKMTVGDLQQWADRKMAGAPQSAQPQSGGLPTNVQARPPVDKRYHIATPEEARAQGLDPNTKWQVSPDGQFAAVPAKGDKPLTESQGKATGYLERAVAASRALNAIPRAPDPSEVNAYLYGLSTSNPLRRNMSPLARQAMSAQESFVMAVLRQDSGAAISAGEIQSAMRIYFPQPGDSAQTQADKRKQREAALRGLRTTAGPGADTVPMIAGRPAPASGSGAKFLGFK